MIILLGLCMGGCAPGVGNFPWLPPTSDGQLSGKSAADAAFATIPQVHCIILAML